MIQLMGISKFYGSIKVLENASLEIQKGTSLSVIGHSGCGKSTLLKIVALITRPDRGVLTIDGQQINGLPEGRLQEIMTAKVAYSFQEPLLIPYMTTLENITDVLQVNSKDAIEMLSLLGLSERLNHRPSKLSSGEKKRVDIARAILRRRSILVADEPLSNLDPSSGLKVMTLLKEYTLNGGTLIYSSVDPADAKFADNTFSL